MKFKQVVNKEMIENKNGFEWIASKLRGRGGPECDVKSTFSLKKQILYGKIICLHFLLCLSVLLFANTYSAITQGVSLTLFLYVGIIPTGLGIAIIVNVLFHFFCEKSIQFERLGIDIKKKIPVITTMYLVVILICLILIAIYHLNCLYTYNRTEDSFFITFLIFAALFFISIYVYEAEGDEFIYKINTKDNKLYLVTKNNRYINTVCAESINTLISGSEGIEYKKNYLKEIAANKKLDKANFWYLCVLLLILLASSAFEPNILLMLVSFSLIGVRYFSNIKFKEIIKKSNSLETIREIFTVADKEGDINGISVIAFIGTSLYFCLRLLGVNFQKLIIETLSWLMQTIKFQPISFYATLGILVVGIIGSVKYMNAIRNKTDIYDDRKQGSQ